MIHSVAYALNGQGKGARKQDSLDLKNQKSQKEAYFLNLKNTGTLKEALATHVDIVI